MNNDEKLISFMHFHNSCTRRGDHPGILINTSDAHKQRMLPQARINTFKKCKREGIRGNRNTVKNDDGGQMVVVITITEINYIVVGLFCNLLLLLLFLYLKYLVLCLRYLPLVLA